MKAYVFMCNWETYDECISRNLFGVSQPYVNDIALGDYCYLYQYDLKLLFGVWKATSKVGWHAPDAWGGKFKQQVQVELATNAITQVPFSQVKHLLDHSGTLIFKLGGKKAEDLLAVFPKVNSSANNK